MDRRAASAAKPGSKSQENKKPSMATAVASPGKGPTTTTTLKAAYAAEVKKVQTELENQRIQSTKLDSVEHKIYAVEERLRESKAHATLNEKKLQHTIQQKDAHLKQLAEVVDELKAEIDRCQTQLDADVKKEAEEKKKTLKEFEKVEKEVKKLREATAEAQTIAQKLRKELAQTKADAEMKVQELRDELDQAKFDAERTAQELRDELEQTKADAEETARELRDELEEAKADAKTDEHALKQNLKQAKADAETKVQALKAELEETRANAETTTQALRKEVDHLVEYRSQQWRDRDMLQETINELRSEVEALETDHRLQNKTIEAGQSQITYYQYQKNDKDLLIETLQDAAQKSEKRISELEALVRGDDMLATAREEQRFSPKPAAPTTQIDLQNAASSIESKSDVDVKMTLEGTLECLRVQTEYILECHDDIFEETQRFRRALTRRPSNENCAPLLVAS